MPWGATAAEGKGKRRRRRALCHGSINGTAAAAALFGLEAFSFLFFSFFAGQHIMKKDLAESGQV